MALLRSVVAFAVALSLCACGGGNGSGGSTSGGSPPPSGQPGPSTLNVGPNAPARGPNTTANLVDPVQTAFPASPAAIDGGPTLKNPAERTTFPLLQAAVASGFSGDASTTSQGATLTLDGASGRAGLTLNNEVLQVFDATVTRERRFVDASTMFGTSIPEGRNLQTLRLALDHAQFGYWLIMREGASVESLNGGAWLGGYITRPGALASTGVREYSGGVAGLFDEGPGSMALLTGDVQVSVDFANRVVTGTLTKLGLASDNYIHGPLNDLAFSAILDMASHTFSASVRVATSLGTVSAFGSEASGVIVGRLFGPNANEIGAVWTLSDASHRLVGSFGAAQAPGAN